MRQVTYLTSYVKKKKKKKKKKVIVRNMTYLSGEAMVAMVTSLVFDRARTGTGKG